MCPVKMIFCRKASKGERVCSLISSLWSVTSSPPSPCVRLTEMIKGRREYQHTKYLCPEPWTIEAVLMVMKSLLGAHPWVCDCGDRRCVTRSSDAGSVPGGLSCSLFSHILSRPLSNNGFQEWMGTKVSAIKSETFLSDVQKSLTDITTYCLRDCRYKYCLRD